MKNLMNKLVNKIKGMAEKVKAVISLAIVRSRLALSNTRGEGFVDSGVKILIAIVIGALLLGGLYLLFNGTILPTLTDKIKELFDYAG